MQLHLKTLYNLIIWLLISNSTINCSWKDIYPHLAVEKTAPNVFRISSQLKDHYLRVKNSPNITYFEVKINNSAKIEEANAYLYTKESKNIVKYLMIRRVDLQDVIDAIKTDPNNEFQIGSKTLVQD